MGTLKVSSSNSLCQWLKTCLGRRSLDGYMLKFSDDNIRHATSSSTIKAVSRRRFNVRAEPIPVMISEKYFGSADTIKDAMIADTKTLSMMKFVFNEPILTNDIITYELEE